MSAPEETYREQYGRYSLTGIRVGGLNHFFSLHIVNSQLTVQYELHVLVLQNLTHKLLSCTSFDCVLKSCMCVRTFFNVLFTCILGQVPLSCAVPIVIWSSCPNVQLLMVLLNNEKNYCVSEAHDFWLENYGCSEDFY